MEDNVWEALVVAASVFHGIAILSTCFRLYHRVQTRRLWWDDFWAFMSLLATVVVLAAFLALPFDKLFTKSRRMITFGYWMTILSFTCSLWTARLSVAVTIVRLLTPGTMRRCSKGMCVVFGIIWIALILQKFFNCGKFSVETWHCPISHSTAYLELSTDIAADLWLLGAPMYMLWKMNLSSRRDHRLIQAIFGCGLLVTVPSILHSVYITRKVQPTIGITAQFQVSTSLIVCNLLVVVTYIYRVFRRDRNEDSTMSASTDKPTTSPPVRRSASNVLHSNNMPLETTAPLSFTEISFSTMTGSNPISTFRSETYGSSVGQTDQTRSV